MNETAGKPLLEITGVTKRFGAFEALKDINLTLEKGRIIGLLGPNGSGKTTLLKLINALLVPTSGSILVAGSAPGTETKKIVSYLPDKNYLPDWMKITGLIHFYQDFYEDFDAAKAGEMLSRMNLDQNARLKTLSKGMKEKVQLALTMSRNAGLYCLDEPIGGVDPASRDYILDTIISNYCEDASVLISTHLISDVERYLDDTIFIKEGRILLHRDAEDIRSENHCSIDAFFREEFKC